MQGPSFSETRIIMIVWTVLPTFGDMILISDGKPHPSLGLQVCSCVQMDTLACNGYLQKQTLQKSVSTHPHKQHNELCCVSKDQNLSTMELSQPECRKILDVVEEALPFCHQHPHSFQQLMHSVSVAFRAKAFESLDLDYCLAWMNQVWKCALEMQSPLCSERVLDCLLNFCESTRLKMSEGLKRITISSLCHSSQQLRFKVCVVCLLCCIDYYDEKFLKRLRPTSNNSSVPIQ